MKLRVACCCSHMTIFSSLLIVIIFDGIAKSSESEINHFVSRSSRSFGSQKRDTEGPSGQGMEAILLKDDNPEFEMPVIPNDHKDKVDGCKTSPCANGGTCDDNGTAVPGQDYTCLCPKGFGGVKCQVVNPCSTCQAEYFHCITTSTDAKKSRYCFTKDWMPLDP